MNTNLWTLALITRVVKKQSGWQRSKGSKASGGRKPEWVATILLNFITAPLENSAIELSLCVVFFVFQFVRDHPSWAPFSQTAPCKKVIYMKSWIGFESALD
ncbi:hypothetical protein CEXT_676291 [Caerostris extrusa]|uniref:Uncharacterized protein n=1 Tax=Caerostris extrusa TaxID=172846 RepID=A0AAV4WRM8_CAEEX|nr:hypothetical protein CEXT_676291 [Caerostris extrusa]